MAARDEGLDRLEAFIAAAAETRANLQRSGARLRELRDHLRGDDVDVVAELRRLDTAVEAFDDRYGDQIEEGLALAFAIGAMVALVGNPPLMPVAFVAVYVISHEVLHEQRKVLREDGDAAIVAYEALGEASVRVESELAHAGQEALHAFEAFDEAADEARGEIDALLRGLASEGLEEMERALEGHFQGAAR